MYCPTEPLSKEKIWEVWYKNPFMVDFVLDKVYHRSSDALVNCDYLIKLGNNAHVIEKPIVSQTLIPFV